MANMAKVKISRPVLYTAVLGVAAYAVVLLTEPDTPPAKHVTHIAVAASGAAAKAPNGFLPEDMKARFARYDGPRRDAFQPRVVVAHALPASGPPSIKLLGPLAGPAGAWTLTGISSINGQQTALLENSAANDSVFVKVGDLWMGQRVARIGDGVVTLISPQGQKTDLTFPAPDDPDKKRAAAAAAAAAPAAGAAALVPGARRPRITPLTLPPAPVPALPGAPGGNRTNG